MIENGNVSVHYVGKFPDVKYLSPEGREPFTKQDSIIAFESAILGKSVGDKITTNIAPENAYGLVREDLVVNVPLDKMPGEVEVGQTLEANGDNGQVAHVVVTAVNEDSVTIDGNHPLAGKELVFDIEVVSIQ